VIPAIHPSCPQKQRPTEQLVTTTPPTANVMNLPCQLGLKFTGKGGVKVKQFLSWMESWFATMGEEFDGGSPASRSLRVRLLHLATPAGSDAWKFINTLPQNVRWDEDLKKALEVQYHDTKMDGQADLDIITTMTTLQQGHHDVFSYSRKVQRLLQRKPVEFRQYNHLLIGYYINGLKSGQLCSMAVHTYQRPDSRETQIEVVKGVVRLARQMKLKGYQRRYDHDDDDKDEEDDEDLSDSDSSESDSDSEDNRGRKSKRKRKKAKKLRKQLQNGKKKGKKGGEERLMREEMERMSEMMRNIMKAQKAAVATGTGVVATRPEEDLIPLDAYAVSNQYEPYQQLVSYQYGRNASLSTPHRPEFPNRRSNAFPAVDYNPGHRGAYPAPYPAACPENAHGVPTTDANVFEPTRRPTEITHSVQDGAVEDQPIVGLNGTIYYPYKPPCLCYHCQEEGHFMSECPRLNKPQPRVVTLGPERPDTPAAPRVEPPAPPHCAPVTVVEIVTKSSALDGIKVREVTAAEAAPVTDLKEFVEWIEEIDKGDDLDSGCATDYYRSEREEEKEVAP